MTDYLEEPWRSCFELAWEAFCAGSIPVGAVVVNAEGLIVARGRNRRAKAAGPNGNLANTAIAHAEINALASLPVGNYSDHTIYTNLEPCLLCTAALAHARVGRIRFAVNDPEIVGIGRVPEVLAWTANRWPVREGPIDTVLGNVSVVMSVSQWFRINPSAGYLRSTKDWRPGLYEIGVRLVETGQADMLTRMTPSAAFGRLAAFAAAAN